MPLNPYQAAAATYRDHAITTASPARVVVLLFERLVLDLERALHALETDQSPNDHLVHAQEILIALLDSLDTKAWEHAPQLANIYITVHQNLITANMEKNQKLIRDSLDIITKLTNAWTYAETQAGELPQMARRGVVDV
jgi:flagellar protein FliS|tara:strand:- start:512 stop:928 length:417 start_codon:yes stop_codon:yes gene_type:complete